MTGTPGTLRYDQIAHDRTCDAWSIDSAFTVFVEHSLPPFEGGRFEQRAIASQAIAMGRVDPIRRVGSVKVSEHVALDPILERITQAFPDVRWYAFANECEAMLRAA